MPTPSPHPASAAARIRVALVDDDPHFRLVVSSVLGASGRHEVVAAAGSAEEALQWPADAKPDVLLLDIGLPGKSGAQLAGELLAKFPGALAVMVSGIRDDTAVLEAIRAGAVGYVLKDADTGRIVAAIDDALGGGAPMSAAIARRVLQLMRPAPPAPPNPPDSALATLTAREAQVLALVAEGASDKDVAEQLGLARSTVKNCLLAIYGKWRVTTRTAAAVKFVRAGGGRS
jgi:DNA-binding NarL/FixJ family response regulator